MSTTAILVAPAGSLFLEDGMFKDIADIRMDAL